MNILSHLYLSKGINQIMLGNFMGDFVKGNSYLKFTPEIQQGILLHRSIDSFTDNHRAHKSSRDRFRLKFGLHSGIITDIIYDHFLAQHWNEFHAVSLEDYAKEVYTYVQNNLEVIPLQLREFIPFMVQNNWLVMYRSIDGIERVLSGMARRTSVPAQIPFAMEVLNKNYSTFDTEFYEIFTDLCNLVKNSLIINDFSPKAV